MALATVLALLVMAYFVRIRELWTGILIYSIFGALFVAEIVLARIWAGWEVSFGFWFGFPPPRLREKLSVDRKNLMRTVVNKVLYKYASTLAKEIEEMEEFIRSVSDFSERAAEALSTKDARSLSLHEERLADAKRVFWRAWRMAKRFGFAVKRSHQDYLKH